MLSEQHGKPSRPWEPERYQHEAPSPAAKLPEGDGVFFLLDTVRRLDLRRFYAPYEQETRGAPPFDPAMIVGLLRYAYGVGGFASRKSALACERNLAFRAMVGQERPDFRTISDCRKLHLEACQDVFVHVVRLAGARGLVRLGNIATDGMQRQGNASRHQAMRSGYMRQAVERLRAAIEAWVTQAYQQDAAEEAALGSRRGDELHLRVLNAPVPRQPHVSSCRFMRSVGVRRGSLCQPGAHGGFLRPPAPWTATEQAAQPREARLETGRRPAARHLLPPRVEPQPPAQPPAHHRQLGRGARAQQGAPPRRGGFRQRPGHQPCPHRGFPTREGLPPSLVDDAAGAAFLSTRAPLASAPETGTARRWATRSPPPGRGARGAHGPQPAWAPCWCARLAALCGAGGAAPASRFQAAPHRREGMRPRQDRAPQAAPPRPHARPCAGWGGRRRSLTLATSRRRQPPRLNGPGATG